MAPNAEDRRPSRDHAAEIAALRRELAEHRDALADLRREVADLRAELAKGAGQRAQAATSAGLSTASPGNRHTTPAAPKPRAPQPHLAAERALPYVDQESPRDAKVAVFRKLFAGRNDVYARRWENRAKGTKGWAPVHRGDWRTRREEREYLPLTDEVIISHLAGRETVGLYPLCGDDSCRLLAVDFDGSSWQLDVQAYVETADAVGVPTAVELSRSGDGAHVWTFFSGRVAAAQARALGAALLRETMALRGELDLDSYDRFFPSQDHLPERGFGNLIALPLQGECRRRLGTTVFVDPRTFEPWEDQFAFLSVVPRLPPVRVSELIDQLQPVTVGPDTALHVSRVRPDPAPPGTIEARLGGMLAVSRAGISASLYVTLKHLATLHNPEFPRTRTCACPTMRRHGSSAATSRIWSICTCREG